MIELNQKTRTVRQCEAAFEYMNDKGELTTSVIRVRYFSPTVADTKREREDITAIAKNDPDAMYFVSDALLGRLESLPDIIDPETKKPFEITKEFLESIDVKNLSAIQKAINNDLAPKSEAAR